MRMGTVCSGIAAPEVAGERLGWPAGLWCAEIETFPSRVLAERFPQTPNLGDITAPDFVDRARAIGVPDVIMGGTPCQSFSVAGRRGGLADERGNLALRFVEICDGLDPDWIIWENVPGALSDPGNAFGSVLGRLAGWDRAIPRPHFGSWPRAGVVSGPRRRLVWRVLDAEYFGVAQQRHRLFVAGCPLRGGDPVGVLFERATLHGPPTPGRPSGQVVGALTANGVGTCGADENQAQAGHLIACAVTAKWATGSGGPSGNECQNLVVVNPRQDPDVQYNVAFCLDSQGDSNAVLTELGVRRLMPIECERLQGFDSDWTAIRRASKTARYKAIGNSMAVPVVEWILKGIEMTAQRAEGRAA